MSEEQVVEEQSTEEVNEEQNALSMSDEEIENLDYASLLDESPEDVQEEETNEAEEDPTDVDDFINGREDTEDEDDEDEDEGEEAVAETEGDQDDEPEELGESDEVTNELPEGIERIFTPFKANGKDIKVDSVDDVITLMQMGANYNKKMAALKPNLRLLKTLQNNDLLDEAKINFLIDLDKKNPQAIQKLLKDGKIDPIELDQEDTEEDYTPNTYNASDVEVELDTVLEEIQDTPSGKDTIEIIGNKWDVGSRDYIAQNPKLITLINQHVESGVYQEISTVMDKEKALGKLTGYTDLEAYKMIGDRLFAEKQQAAQQTQVEPIVKRPASKKSDPKVTSKKRAASTTKSSKSKPKVDFNPLALSDEEFEKLAIDKFI